MSEMPDTPTTETPEAPPPIPFPDVVDDPIDTSADSPVEMAPPAVVDDQTLTEAKCPQCGTKAKWTGPLTAEMIAETFTRGVDEASGLPVCVHCGTLMQAVPFLTSEVAAAPAPLNPVAIAAAELARQDAERAGNAARPVYQPSIPGIRPPFDFRRAGLVAESLERNIAVAEEAWTAAKEAAATRKKDFDGAVEALRKHIQDTRASRIEAEYQARKDDTGAAVDATGAAGRPACISERTTGKLCPICRNADAAHRSINPQAVTHVAAAAAVGAIERTIDADAMVAAIRAVTGLVVPATSLTPWAVDDYRAVGIYLEQYAAALTALDDPAADAASIPRPLALGTPHTIAVQGSTCRDCGALMYQLAVDAGFPDGFPAGQLVGIDCAGDPAAADPPPAEDAPEPARRPRSRHASTADRQRAKQAAPPAPPRDGYPKQRNRTAKASLKRDGQRGRR